jgi:integrase
MAGFTYRLEAGALTVHRSMLPDGTVKAPKTESGNRTAPIVPALRRLLVAWRLRSPHTRPADPVICTARGERCRSATYAAHSRTQKRQLASTQPRGAFPCTRSDTPGPRRATDGLAATTLARVTGHSDPGFTYRVYARDARDDAALVADVLDRAANAGFGG